MGGVQIEYFPQVALALNEEMKSHPLLLASLADMEMYTGRPLLLEEKIGAIAAYCDVMLDGEYYEEDLIVLFHLLLDKLRSKSAVLILPH